MSGLMSGRCSGAACARLVLDLLWCVVSDPVPDLVPGVGAGLLLLFLFLTLISCLISNH